jgi:hypothetical protein
MQGAGGGFKEQPGSEQAERLLGSNLLTSCRCARCGGLQTHCLLSALGLFTIAARKGKLRSQRLESVDKIIKLAATCGLSVEGRTCLKNWALAAA